MMEKEELVSLVRAVQQQKNGAAGELYDAFYDDIYYHILKTVDKDPELAADLTQDTFMEILETIGKLQEPAAFVTWSKQIAYHKCTAYFRKRREILLDEQEDGYSAFDTIEEDRAEFIPGEDLDKEDFKQTIHDMIQELPMEQRTALIMRYFNEYSVKEISQIQGVTEGTVKSRLNYARKALKQAVETYEKKNDVRLHCAGVLPMLLWFFRAYRRDNGMVITSGSASAVYGTTAATTGTATAAATAVAAATTEKTGLAAGISTISKAAATKAIAAVAAVSVAAAGIAAVVSKPEPEKWSGYLQEYRVEFNQDAMIRGDENFITEIPLENSQMYFELEILDDGEDTYTGTLQITWEDGEVYRSDCQIPSTIVTVDFPNVYQDENTIFYSLNTDPVFFRSLWDNIESQVESTSLLLGYQKDTDTIHVNVDGFHFFGELTRETSGKTVFLKEPITEDAQDDSNDYRPDVLTYMKRIDGTYGWVDMYEMEEIDDYYAPPLEDGMPRIAYDRLMFLKSPDKDYAYAYVGAGPQYNEPLIHVVIPDEIDGIPITEFRGVHSSDIVSLELPETIAVITSTAFDDCEKLESVKLPNSIRQIGWGAFNSCTSLKSLVIPEGVETVGEWLFHRCENLKSISFPSTMTELGSYPVSNCPKLESIDVAPGNPVYHSSGNCMIETESRKLLAGCKTSVIPSDGSVTTIGKLSFAENTALTEIVIPEGVKEIEYCAFVRCSRLSSISLPTSMETIDDQAFKFCDNLTDIYYAGTVEEFGKIQGIHWDGAYQNFHITVHCSDGELTIG